MAPSVSITLVGRSFFLCAGGHNVGYDGTGDQSLRNALQHPPGVHNICVAIADDDSYYIHYHDNRGRCYDAWRLRSSYPDLDDYLDGKGVDCPNCVSLSPGGFYFMRTRGGRAWRLPESLDPNADDLTGVWFGKDDAYVAQQADRSHQYNLRGHYGSLGQTLRYGTKTIKSVGLNLTDGSSYIVLWMDGSYQFNGGESGLSKHELESWVASMV